MNEEREVLLAARSLINSGKEKFICDAIHKAGVKLNLSDEAGALRACINAGITMPDKTGPEWSLTVWVYRTYGTDLGATSAFGREHYTARLARLAWLDRLIADRL